jgi:hypothetical protein
MTHISEDVYKRNRRLGSIFTPHALKQIDETYGVPEYSKIDGLSARFVHYTTAEAALKIIKSKRVWMRNTLCMSDYREVQHGFDMLLGFFADKAKTILFYEAFDLSWPGAAKEAVTLFDGWLPDIRANTYIAALSKHHDSEDMNGRLSMWRGFGGQGVPRVAIVLKIPFLSGVADAALKILFSPVAYLDETKVHEIMQSIIESAKVEVDFLKTIDRQIIIAHIFRMLLAAVVCLKHDGFKEEAEWRAIYSPNRQPSPLITSSTEIVSGVPQVVYSLPLDGSLSSELAGLDFGILFDRLIIGPSQYPLPMWTAFVDSLKSGGISDADKRVCASMIPIRG